MKSLMYSQRGILYDEVRFILQQELRETTELLCDFAKAIAARKTRLNENQAA